ncbi:MAG: 23S rRNA (guanosine(2251)-2'-O)-methyltransferase RlmB [Actinobacteria bacterium]|nr:MAG: 23S rRNA (guanosine(2251)-2'-O)-methyltransferase RlmB [Actinomycetota bacterium]
MRPDGRGLEFAIGGRRPVTEAIRSGHARRILLANGLSASGPARALLAEADAAGVSVTRVERAALDRHGVRDHQGVVAMVAPPPELDERALAGLPLGPHAIAVVLDGIEDPQNFGAAARSAEAAGAAMLVVRSRRAAPLTPAAIRASAGAVLHLPVARVTNLRRTIDALKDRGLFVAGLDHLASATIDDTPPPDGPVALVLGAEEAGISRLVKESCDLLVAIPMRGRTGSLNASAALAVGLFGWLLRSRSAGVAQPGSASDL